jgi:hypothetical protein
VLVFHTSLPALGQPALTEIFATLSQVLHRWRAGDALLVVWIAASAYLLGGRFLNLLKVPVGPGPERRWLSVTLGISLLTLLLYVLAAVRLLYTASVYGLLVLPFALDAGKISRGIAHLRVHRPSLSMPPILSLRSLARAFVIALGIFCLGMALLLALAPELEFDPLFSHLAAAQHFAQYHSLKPLLDVPQAMMPRHIVLLYAMGLLLKPGVPKLIDYLLGLLVCWGVCAWATRRFSRDTGLVAGVILVSSPIFLWEMGTTHVDCGLTLYVFLSLYAVVEWLDSGDPRWRALAIWGTAFSLGAKYQALFSLGALTVVIAAYPLISSPLSTRSWKWAGDLRREIQASGMQAGRFFLTAALGLIPWAIVSYSQTRNPLYPFLNGVFKSRYFSPEQAQQALMEMKDSGSPVTVANWPRIFTIPWDMVKDTQGHFHGNIGILFFLFIPLLLFHKIQPAVRAILLFSFGFGLFWVFTGQHARFFLAALPGLAVVSAYACVNWLETLRERCHWTAAAASVVVLAFMAVLNTPAFETYGAGARYGNQILDILPTKLLAGEETQDQFLAQKLEDYAVVAHLNSLPGKKKVLFWWNAQPISFYVDGESVNIATRLFETLAGADPAKLPQLLRDNGVTHVIAGQTSATANPLTNPEGDFVRQHLKELYRQNGMILYAVSVEPLTQEVTVLDLLDHVDEAQIKMPSQPAKPNGSYRGVSPIGSERRYSLLTFPPAEVEFQVTLDPHLGPHMALRFGTGREFPPCQEDGSFQVWLKAANRKPEMIFTMEARGSDEHSVVAWSDHEIDLSPYANQTVALTLKTTAASDACGWFLWGDPRVVARP